MKLQDFITKNDIQFASNVEKLCIKALDIMSKSVDPSHDHRHIEEMLTNLNYLVNKMPDVKNTINFNALLLSICWHDTWTSFRKPENIVSYIANQAFEGYGSAFMFKKYAQKANLSKRLIIRVFYTIIKHSSFQLLPPVNLESKILIDLDKIEMWNHYRMFNREKDKIKDRVEFFKSFWVKTYYKFIGFKSMYFKKLELRTRKKMKQFEKFISNFEKTLEKVRNH